MFGTKTHMVAPAAALPGRDAEILDPHTWHEIFGIPVVAVPRDCEVIYLALGCFWGAERLYWLLDGVKATAVGYQGGYTPNPTYEEVCSGRTGHAETVRVCYDPSQVGLDELLNVFFENHDPTQGMRQGADVGTQYRSAIYTTSDAQAAAALAARDRFQQAFSEHGFGTITTEIAPAGPFYFAEAYHQQYLEKVPNGYCPIHATGVTCR